MHLANKNCIIISKKKPLLAKYIFINKKFQMLEAKSETRLFNAILFTCEEQL